MPEKAPRLLRPLRTYSPLAKSFMTLDRLVNVRTGIKAKGSWNTQQKAEERVEMVWVISARTNTAHS